MIGLVPVLCICIWRNICITVRLLLISVCSAELITLQLFNFLMKKGLPEIDPGA